MYIHHLNFCQLKHELEQDEKRRELLEELRDYHNLKTFWSDIHIKTLYRQCNEVELNLVAGVHVEGELLIYLTSPILTLIIALLYIKKYLI